MKNTPIEIYRNYCKPSELQKAINSLCGIVSGIKADGVINNNEIDELINWCQLRESLKEFSPFSEILPVIWDAIEDGVLDNDEREDILWLCSRAASWRNDNLSVIQYLHGFLHGLLADGVLNDQEILALQAWIEDADFLKGTYPYDEIDSLLTSVLADHRVSEDERGYLMAFLSDFIDITESYNLNAKQLSELRAQYEVRGICACCPEIDFNEKVFCFTGESERAMRAEFAHEVSVRGGVLRDNVSSKTDYLIVGNKGNPCWAFACYGRKIEKAIELRKAGGKVVIVNENDFWDAIEN